MDPKYILEHFKSTGYRVNKTARDLDIDRNVLEGLFVSDIKPPRKPKEPLPLDFRQVGKVGLRRFVVAVKACNEAEWPEKHGTSIHAARRKYDAGTHEVFTETRDGWNILYCQPRRNPVPHRYYFFEDPNHVL